MVDIDPVKGIITAAQLLEANVDNMGAAQTIFTQQAQSLDHRAGAVGMHGTFTGVPGGGRGKPILESRVISDLGKYAGDRREIK